MHPASGTDINNWHPKLLYDRYASFGILEASTAPQFFRSHKAMDDSIVRSHTEQLRYVPEKTSHLEITLHTDSKFDTNIEEPLIEDEISDWLSETGRFTPKILPEGVKKIASLRLILQIDVQSPDTFDTNVVSLPPATYLELLKSCRLSTRAVDSASVIGPLFWYQFGVLSSFGRNISDNSLQIIYRKTDSGMTNTPNGFVLFMSHIPGLNSSVVGFYKATKNTEITTNIMHIRRTALEILHPMLIPVILLSSNIGPRQERHQQQARAKLHDVENAIVKQLASIDPNPTSLERINVELMKCHASVWKNPGSSYKVIDGVEYVLTQIDNNRYKIIPEQILPFEDFISSHLVNNRYAQRVKFIRWRLRGIESYCHTTLSKIDVQRTTLHNLLLHRQNETALQIEQRQRLEAERKFSVNQTWNKNQKTISLLGIFFLPGAFIASIFSTTFFNFQAAPGQTVVSDRFWIFWALTVPITGFVLAVWWMKERIDKARAGRLETDLERMDLKTE